MRNTALFTRASSMFCLRTVSCGNQTVFTKQLSKLCSPLQPHSVSNKLIFNRGNYLLLKGACPLYTSTQQLQQKSPQKQQKPQFPQQGEGFVHDFDEEVEILSHTHSDIGWGVRLSAENGYLSWMRNTYIMTVAGVAMLHSEVAPLAPIAGTGVFMVAGLNMVVGTLGFLYNLSRLKKERHISGLWGSVGQILTILHLVLWCSLLIVFLPEFEKAEESLETELHAMEEAKKDK